ncbi:MAG: aconitase family protein [Candidatus Aenigmatarchaeota archaeon]
MIERKIEIRKDPRILVLTQGCISDLIDAQLNGFQIYFYDQEIIDNLMWGVSTDEILPSKAGKFQSQRDLSFYALSGISGIDEGRIKDNFNVLVVGGRFGGGSAREHAPRALKGAGIELIIVVGGNAEKIFKENCLNNGGPYVVEIPKDIQSLQALVDGIRERRIVSLVEEINPLSLKIIESGGLIAFTKKRLSNQIEIPQISRHSDEKRPMTAVEKILFGKLKNLSSSTHFVQPGDVGIIGLDMRFSYEFMTKMMIEILAENGLDAKKEVIDPESIVLFEDHLVWSADSNFASLIQAQKEISRNLNFRLFEQEENLPGSLGICHTLIVEKAMVLPGQTIIGTDSHTCSAGVLGSFAFGAGATAVAASLISKEAVIKVPPTVKIVFSGSLNKGVTAKDVMLFLLSKPYIKEGRAIGKVFEFAGAGIQDWGLDELFVLTNMAVEGGGITGIIPEPLKNVVHHISEVTGLSLDEICSKYVRSDEGAIYDNIIEIDLSEIEPMVALPGHPTNGRKLSDVRGTAVTKGYVGSCTGGKITDLRDVANVLKNRKVKVPLVVQAASMNIVALAREEGIVDIIEQSGAQFLLPGCGACIGLGPGGITEERDVIISDTNRNFPGRMGRPNSRNKKLGEIYLSSPRVVASSAIRGYICAPEDLDY